MTAHTRTHGGQAAQAKRRQESWIACTDCTSHDRRRRQADPIEADDVTPVKIAGLVVFAFALLFGVPLAVLIIGTAVRS